MLVALMLATVVQAPAAEPARAAVLNPDAVELFERSPELKAWALRLHDRNGDGWLSLYEAQPAVQALKEIADADRDGRVTVREFEAAQEFIRARWAAGNDHD